MMTLHLKLAGYAALDAILRPVLVFTDPKAVGPGYAAVAVSSEGSRMPTDAVVTVRADGLTSLRSGQGMHDEANAFAWAGAGVRRQRGPQPPPMAGRFPTLPTGGKAGLDALLAHVPPAALVALERLGLSPGGASAGVLNWLAGWERRGAKREFRPELAERRLQASLAYPLLPFLVADINAFDTKLARSGGCRVDGTSPEEPSRVEIAVDTCAPLGDALAAQYRLGRWAVRRLVGVRLEDIVTPTGSRFQIGAMLSNLRHVAPDHVPTSAIEWEAFRTVANLAYQSAAEKATTPERLILRDALLRSVRGRWVGVDQERARGAGLADVTADVAANLVSPALDRIGIAADSMAVASRLLWSGRTVAQTMAASAVWHERHRDVQRRLAAAFPPTSVDTRRERATWPPLAAEFRTPAGWVVRPLTTAASLVEEGAAMAHCVGEYTDACRYEGSHILSIRDSKGRRASTVEIDEDALVEALSTPSGDPLDAVEQHYSRDNGDPSKGALTAIAAWAEAVRSGALTVDPRQLAVARAARRRAAGWKADGPAACYDAVAPEAAAAAFAEYANLLPRALRHGGADGFDDACAAAAAWEPPAPPSASEAETSAPGPMR